MWRDFTTWRWHRAIIKDARQKLGRPLKGDEITFITRRRGGIALEMTHDTVKTAGKEELEKYLAQEQQTNPYNLARFTSAQDGIYDQALAEIKRGEKQSHWMWFVFPQIADLGFSGTSRFYAIKNIEEARQYLQHPVLGARLLECANAVLAVEGRSASDIFGYPDDLKLKSCMTLFAVAAGAGSVFERVLEKYCNSERDEKTIKLLRLNN